MAAKRTLMLVQKTSHALSFYDLESHKEEARIALPDFPHEFVVDAANAFAYVTHYGVHNSSVEGPGGHQVFVVDIAKREVVQTLDTGEHGRVHGIAMDGSGGLYILSELTDTLLYKRNPRSDEPGFDSAVSTGGTKSHLFALTKDGRRAYSMNLVSNDITVFDPHDPEVTPQKIRTGEKPEGRHLRYDEKILFVTNRISNTVSIVDTGSLSVTTEFPTPEDPVRIYHDEKRDRLVTAHMGEPCIAVFDAKDGREIERIELPAASIAASFDDAFENIFVSVDCDQLKIVDLTKLEVVDTLDTLKEPDVSYILLEGY